MPFFQTFLAQTAAAYLSSELGTEIRIDKVDIVFFDKANIEGVFVEDIRHDTLLYAQSLRVNFAEIDLSNSFIDIDEIKLTKTAAHIIQYKGDTTFNFQHFIDYFASTEEDTSSSNFKLNVRKLKLDDVNFVYQDQNAVKTDFGLDYSDLDIRHLNGELSKFEMGDELLRIKIDDLQFNEKSGLRLNKLTASVLYSETLIQLDNLTLAYNNSLLVSDQLQLKTPNGSADFSNFVHDVYFKGNVRNSMLDLADVAYFAPVLNGMDAKIKLDNVNLSGPVYGMKLDSLVLSTLSSTRLIGNFQIPNLDDPEEAFFEERIALFQTTVSDVQSLKLTPFLDGEDYIVLPASMVEADLIQIKDGHLTGYMSNFQADGDLTSGLGNVSSEYGLRFFMDDNQVLNYESGLETGSGRDLIIDSLDLGALTGNDLLGKVTGFVSIGKGSKGTSMDQLDLKFAGHFTEIELDNYAYQSVDVVSGSFRNNVFTGNIDIADDNLALNYVGSVDLKGQMKFDFIVEIDSASLTELNYKQAEFVDRLVSKIEVHIEGTSLDKIKGTVEVRDLDYEEGDIDFSLNKLDLSITRSEITDSIALVSDYVDIILAGKFDLENLWPVVQNQLARVINHVINETDASASKNEFYDLKVNMKDVNPLLQFVDPLLYIAEDSKIRSSYTKKINKLSFEFTSDLVSYDGMKFSDIVLRNYFDSIRANVQYEIGLVQLSDSLGVRNAALFSYLKNNHFSTNIGWDRYMDVEPALFAFTTEIANDLTVSTEFNPSFFFLRSEKWNISPKSKLVWNPDLIEFKDFDIVNKNHLVNVHGKVSKNPADWLYFQVRDFDLADLNGILDGIVTIGGVLNIDGGVSDVYNNIRFMSLTEIKSLIIDDELVGDLLVDNKWNKDKNSVEIFGNLKRDRKETFKFSGNYFPSLEKENLNMSLTFDNTDIGFLNAFSDPELYTDIAGILNGKLFVSGELLNPKVNGALQLLSTRLKVPMLNVGFGLAGELKFEPERITASNMTVVDEEGNRARATVDISHFAWGNWKYLIGLDMNGPGTDDRFMAMNTFYRDGDLYYGKAYVNGVVTVKGTPELTEMDIDANTLRGTDLKLAMYGTSDLEESSFILFDTIIPSQQTKGETTVDQLESSGLVMKMKFNISKDTKTTIVFDPIFDDQIVIDQGEGQLEMLMDEYGEIEMRGQYVILDGTYYMRVKGLVQKDFQIESGSDVKWTGSPYDAYININANYETSISLEPILPEGAPDKSNEKETVIATLMMSRTLMDPAISFKIAAPYSDDISQTALRALEADKDQLNKQFFSILAIGKFSSTQNGTGGTGNAAVDFAEGQINELLNKFSDKYDLAADLGGNTKAIDVKTQVSDKITITTSLGVVSGEESGGLIGDVNIEYRLNDDGSFTVNVFNTSNQGVDATNGPFTQGVSLHYEEVFDNAKEFKLLQGFLNIFRSKAKDVDYKKAKSNGKKQPVNGAKEEILNEQKVNQKPIENANEPPAESEGED